MIKKRGKRNLYGASRFVSEPCLWFRMPRSPSDNVGFTSESHPDLPDVLDQVLPETSSMIWQWQIGIYHGLIDQEKVVLKVLKTPQMIFTSVLRMSIEILQDFFFSFMH